VAGAFHLRREVDFADPVRLDGGPAQKKAPGEAGAVKYKGHSDRVNDGSPVRTFNVGRQASVPGRLCHFDNAIDVTVVHYRHVD
jgi:hypothetical protein